MKEIEKWGAKKGVGKHRIKVDVYLSALNNQRCKLKFGR